MDELERLTPDAFRAQEKTPIALVLDNVRSAHNVGSAFRTADAFALKHICLCGITAQPPHREILKTALGATETVDWSYHHSVADAVTSLQAQGYQVWAVEQVSGSRMLQDFAPSGEQPIALIFGNEVDGVSDEALARVDGALEIPQFGTKHSLNVSVSMGIVVWEVFRRMKL